MTRPQYSYTTLDQFITFLNTAVGYLEKANASNLGDFTTAGKTVNAGYNNYTVYWQWYKELGYSSMQGEAYCACAVSTMLANAFGLDKAKKLLCGDLYTYCPTGYQQFKNKGRIVTTPKAGDVVFFWSDSMGRYSHTGWVIKIDSDGKGYTTWEANTSSGNDVVIRNGGATCNKHYTLGARKAAFGRPDWASYGISTSGSSASTATVEKPALTTYDISVGTGGLVCTTDSLRLRDYPVTGSILGNVKKGEAIFPSKKTFVDGKPWYYIAEKKCWCSASYFTGWVCEKSAGNRWWYMLNGYQYYTDQIVTIGGNRYYFDSNGYMFIGTLTFTTDENGALTITSSES